MLAGAFESDRPNKSETPLAEFAAEPPDAVDSDNEGWPLGRSPCAWWRPWLLRSCPAGEMVSVAAGPMVWLEAPALAPLLPPAEPRSRSVERGLRVGFDNPRIVGVMSCLLQCVAPRLASCELLQIIDRSGHGLRLLTVCDAGCEPTMRICVPSGWETPGGRVGPGQQQKIGFVH